MEGETNTDTAICQYMINRAAIIFSETTVLHNKHSHFHSKLAASCVFISADLFLAL